MIRLFFCRRHKKASVLVICLWALVILSALGMGLSSLVFQEVKVAGQYERLSFSAPIASSAVKKVFYDRQSDASAGYDTFGKLSKENSFTFSGGLSYKYYFLDKIGDSKNQKFIDEGALINLNTASADVLKRLPGMDEDFVQSLIFGGYRPFSSINEVLLVEGAKKENFLLFKDLVTVYGTGKININTAQREVLMAIGLDSDLADIILRFRTEHKIQPPPDAPAGEAEYGFSNINTALDELRNYSSLSLRQEQDFLSCLNVLTVKSEYLRFNVIPVVGTKEGIHYSIVIHPATKKVLSWREG